MSRIVKYTVLTTTVIPFMIFIISYIQNYRRSTLIKQNVSNKIDETKQDFLTMVAAKYKLICKNQFYVIYIGNNIIIR